MGANFHSAVVHARIASGMPSEATSSRSRGTGTSNNDIRQRPASWCEMNRDNRCKCGYTLGEGYQNCPLCVAHNVQKATEGRQRRCTATSVVGAEDNDFEMGQKARFPRGISQNAVILHKSVSQRVKHVQGVVHHVETALEIPSHAKARAYVQALPPPAATVVAAPVARKQTLDEADAVLQASGWRRCVTQEKGCSANNLEHDKFEVVFIQRDGDCLFHCLCQILDTLGVAKCDGQSAMRGIIADFFDQNKNSIQCAAIAEGEGAEALTLDYSCECVQAIRSGKGGRRAYGGVAEIVAFCVKYGVTVTVFSPENGSVGDPPITYNPGDIDGEFPRAMVLNTLAWGQNKQRSAGQDHWQLLKYREVTTPQLAAPTAAATAVPPSSVSSPLLPQAASAATSECGVSTHPPVAATTNKRAAAKQRAQSERQQQDVAACEATRQFIASGGKYDFTEPVHACDAQPPRGQEVCPPEQVHVISSGDEGSAQRGSDANSAEKEFFDDGKEMEGQELANEKEGFVHTISAITRNTQ